MLKRGLLILLLTLAGCGPKDAILPSPTQAGPPLMATLELSQAMQREAEALALEAGIPIQEAMWRIGIMEASGVLNAQLEENEADTFAGLWLVNQPDYRVVVAFTRVGEVSCFSPVAGELTPQADGLLRSPLPAGCSGPYFLVGEVELAFWEDMTRTMVEVSLVDLEVGSLYFIRKTPSLDAWVAKPAAFSGKLVWQAGSRCLRLQRDNQASFQDFLVIWPPDYAFQAGAGTVVDEQGGVVARLNEEVNLFGELVKSEEGIRMLLNEELPCDCVGGDYWAVLRENP